MIASDKFGLPIKVIKYLKEIFDSYSNIEDVLLYGSRAMGTFKNGSDIDLVLVAPKMNLTQLLEIENKIEDLLIPYKVDLSLFHKIDNPNLIKHINENAVDFI